jgi:glyoxylate/hydroxypyruvate reductase A
MGIGTIGLRVASGLAQSGFKVIGWARTEKNASGIVVFAGDDQLPEFLSKCNYLICLLPLTDHTRGILNANVFQHLPENAYLINAGRGEHLNEVDLIAYLDSGHLSGATLDVFIEEPLPSDHPFWGHPKIKITPHIASVTNPRSCVAQVLENYDRMKHNRPLLNIVSRQKGY